MTLFSYHKYNDFILIQEIYTQKYTACTKDEANRIADNNLQSDGISYANGLAQAEAIVLAMLQACMYLIQVKVEAVKNKKERLIILSFLYKPKIFSLSMI